MNWHSHPDICSIFNIIMYVSQIKTVSKLTQMYGNGIRHSRINSNLVKPEPEWTLQCLLRLSPNPPFQLVHLPVQGSFNTQFYIPFLHSEKHQCDTIFIQCSSCLLDENLAVIVLLVHLYQRISAQNPGYLVLNLLSSRTNLTSLPRGRR